MIGSIVGGCVWYAQSCMIQIDDAYRLFVIREAKGAATARQVNRLMFELKYWVYRIAAETEDVQMKAANQGFEAALPQHEEGAR